SPRSEVSSRLDCRSRQGPNVRSNSPICGSGSRDGYRGWPDSARIRGVNRRTFLASSAASLLAGAAPSSAAKDWEWRYYGADQGATRYAPLDQITPVNVTNLEIAWTHHTGDAMERPQTTIESTPIVVDGILY